MKLKNQFWKKHLFCQNVKLICQKTFSRGLIQKWMISSSLCVVKWLWLRFSKFNPKSDHLMLKNLTYFWLRILKILEIINGKGHLILITLRFFKKRDGGKAVVAFFYFKASLSGTTSACLPHFIVTKLIFWLDLINKTAKGR